MNTGRLTIISTPIGNLGDMSQRAVDSLQSADRILCEDTRHSARLLNHFGIERPTSAYHDHSDDRARARYLAQMADGQHLALISDAGTPLISDPGYKLVAEAIDAGLRVSAVPGPAAPIMALTVSGLPSNRFLFEGFLPAKAGARASTLKMLAPIPATLLFFESGPRLATSLAAMADVLGDREAAVTRELTKTFEEVRRGRLSALTAHYHEAGAPKGEIVVVVAPPKLEVVSLEDPQVTAAIDAGLGDGMRVKDLAAALSAQFHLPKKDLYAAIQAHKDAA